MKNFTPFVGLILLLSFGFSLKSQTLWELRPNYDINSNPFFDGIDTVPLSELGGYKVVEQVHELDGEELEITIVLPSGNSLDFKRDYADIDTFNVITWFGKNEDIENYPNSVAQFSSYNDSLLGYITINDSVVYKILPIGNNHFVCFESKYHKDCDSDLMMNYNNLNLSSLNPSFNPVYCNGLAIYRMIIAYTPEFANTFPLINRQYLINRFIENVVYKTNQTYIQSNTDVRVRLALSYMTDNEFGNKDSDATAFAKKEYEFLWSSRSDKYDEIFDLISQYYADVAILLVSYNDGGRAHPRSQTAIYSKLGAGLNYGVAHEVGHMFNLEHNREEYNWFQKRIKDLKKAYGFRGWTGGKKSVMSYGAQERVYLYSDPGYQFPGSSQYAGNSKAKARNYLNSHIGNVIRFPDHTNWNQSGRTIYYNQMTSQFADVSITLENYTIQGGAEANYRAASYIELRAGTTINNGASVLFEIEDCENTQVFKKKIINDSIQNNDLGYDENLIVYPNPSNSTVNVSLEMDTKKNYDLYLFDAMGKLKFKLSGTSILIDKMIDLSEFKQGMYFIRVVTDSIVYQKKIIKI